MPLARAGWILFADQDVLCDEMGFKLPFAKYEGKDLVLWGSAKLVRQDEYQSLLSVSHKDRQQGKWMPRSHCHMMCLAVLQGEAVWLRLTSRGWSDPPCGLWLQVWTQG